MVDDIGDTLGTLRGAARAYREKGAREIRAILCHPVLSPAYKGKPSAEENLELMLSDGTVDEVIFGNTIPLSPPMQVHPKVKTIPVEPFVAEAIKRLHWDRSVSRLHDYRKIVEAYQDTGRYYPDAGKLIEIRPRAKQMIKS